MAVDTALVRPYTRTKGRTKPRYVLELETLISARAGMVGDGGGELAEHHSVVDVCPAPRSVAEIATALRLPLGVARVLVSDAADAGLVDVHRALTSTDSAQAHLKMMERVLSGLHRL